MRSVLTYLLFQSHKKRRVLELHRRTELSVGILQVRTALSASSL